VPKAEQEVQLDVQRQKLELGWEAMPGTLPQELILMILFRCPKDPIFPITKGFSQT
jgi:hypothetical protein